VTVESKELTKSVYIQLHTKYPSAPVDILVIITRNGENDSSNSHQDKQVQSMELIQATNPPDCRYQSDET
jgi:hypothetical protein